MQEGIRTEELGTAREGGRGGAGGTLPWASAGQKGQKAGTGAVETPANEPSSWLVGPVPWAGFAGCSAGVLCGTTSRLRAFIQSGLEGLAWALSSTVLSAAGPTRLSLPLPT